MREMKDSGIEWIGKIPANNNIVRNKYYVSYTKGKNPISLNSEGFGKPYIGASDLDALNNTYENYTTDEYIPECTKDDILVLWDGARAGLLGTNKIGCISSTIAKLEVIPEVIYTRFFFWYLKGFEKFLSDMVTGTTIPHMNRRYIEDIQFIDFSLYQQQAIADYLDGECARIDGLVEKQRSIIEKLKEYKKSVITEAVTHGLNSTAPMKDSGIEWIGKIPEHWEISKLKYYSKYITDGTHTTPEYLADGVPFLSIKDISAGKLDFSNTKYISQQQHEELSKHAPIEKGDILFTRIGTLGVSVIVETDITFDIFVSVGLLKPKDTINTKYLNYVMNSEYYYQYIQLVKAGEGTSAAKFNLSDVSNSPIVCPPLSEQQAIADYLDRKCSEIDSIIEKRERMIELMTEYKKSLIYECVTGKKEIVDVVE